MSVPLSLKARVAAAALNDKTPSSPVRALAEPPEGSGLLPVMGQGGLPVVGSTFPFLQQTLKHCRQVHEQFGEVSWGNILRTDFVMVLGPDGITEVLANRDKAFSSQSGWEHFIGPFFDGGVMLMDFEEHLHHRRIMQQGFKRDRLIDYLGSMNSVIARQIGQWPESGEIEIYSALKQLTLDIATEVFMGAELGDEASELNDAFVNVVAGGQAIVRSEMPGGKWRRGLESRRVLAEYFREQIPSKRAGNGTDLFSVLCHAETEDGDTFSDEDIVNHMIFTMMAAHDTSTITTAMMAFYLAQNRGWQERLRDESIALGKVQVGYDDLESLPALDLVFKETLRMNAPVGVLARQAIKDTQICGHYVPAGTRLMLGLYPTHRMEQWWDDPHRFDPERFTPERASEMRHKDAWIPFGGYAHKCIGMHFGGMEVKAIMHQLLLKYQLSVRHGYEPVIDYGTGPFPADGLPINLRRL